MAKLSANDIKNYNKGMMSQINSFMNQLGPNNVDVYMNNKDEIDLFYNTIYNIDEYMYEKNNKFYYKKGTSGDVYLIWNKLDNIYRRILYIFRQNDFE